MVKILKIRTKVITEVSIKLCRIKIFKCCMKDPRFLSKAAFHCYSKKARKLKHMPLVGELRRRENGNVRARSAASSVSQAKRPRGPAPLLPRPAQPPLLPHPAQPPLQPRPAPSPGPALPVSRALPPHPPRARPRTRSGGRAAAPSPGDPGTRPFRKDRLGVRVQARVPGPGPSSRPSPQDRSVAAATLQGQRKVQPAAH